jgi:ferredoxin
VRTRSRCGATCWRFSPDALPARTGGGEIPVHAQPASGGRLTTGLVLDIRKYSIHDGPGIRTTVFLKGCGLSCWWCHNPESQAPGFEAIVRDSRCIRCGACVGACGHGAITWTDAGPVTDRAQCAACGDCSAVCYAEARERVGREMAADEVLAEVLQDLPFYEESGGGMTLSGGDPLLRRLLRRHVELGSQVAGKEEASGDPCGRDNAISGRCRAWARSNARGARGKAPETEGVVRQHHWHTARTHTHTDDP